MTIQQVASAFARYITGLRPGDDGWGPEDDEAYDFALNDRAFSVGAKNTEQALDPTKAGQL